MTPAELERVREERLHSAIEFVLRNSQSRLFLLWILQSAGIYSTSYNGERVVEFKEGERNMGLKIIGKISERFPAAYPDLLAEHAQMQLRDLMLAEEPVNDAD